MGGRVPRETLETPFQRWEEMEAWISEEMKCAFTKQMKSSQARGHLQEAEHWVPGCRELGQCTSR